MRSNSFSIIGYFYKKNSALIKVSTWSRAKFVKFYKPSIFFEFQHQKHRQDALLILKQFFTFVPILIIYGVKNSIFGLAAIEAELSSKRLQT